MRVLDVNILIYAFDSLSPQHGIASDFLKGIYATDDLVGLPSIVLLAYLRISTNPRVMSTPATGPQAFERMNTLRNHPKSVMIEPGPNHWYIFQRLVIDNGVFGPSVTDAYLAALAIEVGATFCSHDNGFRRFTGLKFENPLAG